MPFAEVCFPAPLLITAPDEDLLHSPSVVGGEADPDPRNADA